MEKSLNALHQASSLEEYLLIAERMQSSFLHKPKWVIINAITEVKSMYMYMKKYRTIFHAESMCFLSACILYDSHLYELVYAY